jgi:hypothetical protein
MGRLSGTWRGGSGSRSVWWGAVGGCLLGALILYSLRWLTIEFGRSVTGPGPVAPMLSMILLLLLGAVIFAVVTGRGSPLLPGIPAVALAFVYLPLAVDLAFPTWYPRPVRDLALITLGPAPYLLLGVLLGATVRAIWSTSVDASQASGVEVEHPAGH